MKSERKTPYLLIICLVFLLCLVVSVNCIQVGLVEGDSMVPSYHSGQLVLVNKMAEDYLPGDVVLFYSRELGSFLIKRVVACPGDTLIINGGQLYVNREAVPGYADITRPGLAEKEIVLSGETYFLMGDNISDSVDSRDERIGPISLSDIKGKVIRR